MLILGGLVVALSVENSDLHRRIALSVLRVVGVQRRWWVTTSRTATYMS